MLKTFGKFFSATFGIVLGAICALGTGGLIALAIIVKFGYM